ncbi:MAG TPA: ribose-phosphate pyrophosphokinase [Firmicutes bacterium]|nr:ribose-phosphate pyrophosphokinase [Bacillota bacterium]
MVVNGEELKIFCGSANRALAEEIADYVGVPLGDCEVNRFSDGEISISIRESVRGTNAFLIQPLCGPINESIMELLIIIDALRRASAKAVNAVIPYYAYARQDRKTRARDPITAKLLADLITAAGTNRVVAMDLHAGQIQGFFNIPLDHLTALPILAKYFKNKQIDNGVVVSPDLGGVTRARDLANRLMMPIAIIDKKRPAPNQAEIMHIIGDVKGKTAIFIDDMIDTGGTITLGAEALMREGAQEVYASCTHPVFSGPALKRLSDSCITEVIYTNTIPVDKGLLKGLRDCFKVLSVAPLIGEAIIRIQNKISVSELFD